MKAQITFMIQLLILALLLGSIFFFMEQNNTYQMILDEIEARGCEAVVPQRDTIIDQIGRINTTP